MGCACTKCKTFDFRAEADSACIRQFAMNADGGRLCGHYSKAVESRILSKEEADDILHRLTWNSNKPVTRCQKFGFCMKMCCICVYTFVCPPCPPCIIHKIAFSPPKPTYDMIPFGPRRNGDYRIRLCRDAKDITNRISPQCAQFNSLFRCFYIPKSSAKSKGIACIYARSLLLGAEPRMTILLSHINGEDLGFMVSRIAELCQRLAVNVLAYDYSGYGRSSGPCSEKNLYKDIERVYDFMIHKLQIPGEQVVAIGSSLGTAATVHLASEKVVRAVVLQGSFSSALGTLCPERRVCSCWDKFPNEDKIGNIVYPTLFVHGEKDEMFSVDHLFRLRAKCPGAAEILPLIIKNGRHCDFDLHDAYWERLHYFMRQELQAPQRPCVESEEITGDSDPQSSRAL